MWSGSQRESDLRRLGSRSHRLGRACTHRVSPHPSPESIEWPGNSREGEVGSTPRPPRAKVGAGVKVGVKWWLERKN